jgi:hypothetical protein
VTGQGVLQRLDAEGRFHRDGQPGYGDSAGLHPTSG